MNSFYLHPWTFKMPPLRSNWAVMTDKDDADWVLKVPNCVSYYGCRYITKYTNITLVERRKYLHNRYNRIMNCNFTIN